MEMFVIQGGRPLSGRVRVSGAKNAALPILAASIMTHGRIILQNIPQLVDISSMLDLLKTLGVESHGPTDGQMVLQTTDESGLHADYELVRKMRASFCVLGPLLAKRGHACVSLPGGCNIGDRPIDLHLKGLTALGAEIRIDRGYVIAHAKKLRGARINLSGPFGSTVTGTCNVMSAAVLADGQTIIECAACEPEVVDLGQFLIKMGAQIQGLGTSTIVIDGVDKLRGATHRVIPDRIEAATLMMAAGITRGNIVLEEVPHTFMHSIVETLQQIGMSIELDHSCAADDDQRRPRVFHPDFGLTTFESAMKQLPGGNSNQSPTCQMRIRGDKPLQATDCTALPYPGLPTDVQAQLTSLLTCARGTSIVTDKVFSDRFMHTSELNRMGAQIRRHGNSAIINGVRKLTGASVMASDLRASAALVLAGLCAEGETVIRRIYHLDRGYEELERKLTTLGAHVFRVKDTPHAIPSSLKHVSTSPVVPGPIIPTQMKEGFRLDQAHPLNSDQPAPPQTERLKNQEKSASTPQPPDHDKASGV
jgi:UDP-N-acetylglucosamine 1-carboxyvinyltransferase